MRLTQLLAIVMGICLIGCQTASTDFIADPDKLIQIAGEAVRSATATPTIEITTAPTESATQIPLPTVTDVLVTRPPPATFTPIPQLPTATATATKSPTNTPQITETPEPTPTLLPTPTALPSPTKPTTADLAFTCPSLSSVAHAKSPYLVSRTKWPRPAPSPYELHIGYVNTKLIHLGFDVEGNAAPVPAILDVLDKYQIKTTMFVLGAWAEVNPDLVREMANRGHEFANHTYSHANMKNLSADQVLYELNATEAIINNLTGKTTKPWFRPPYGSRSEESIQTAYDAGWTTVIWTGSTDDWRPEYGVEEMCGTLLSGTQPGSILYTHTARPEIPALLDRYIATMQAQGYTFVPMSVLMSDNPNAYLLPQE